MVSMHVATLVLAISGVGETVLLDFQAAWCGPCQAMNGTVDRLSAAGYPVRKVNVDHERDLAARFGVQTIPCFVLVVEGREVDRVVGATSLDKLEAMFRKAHVGPPQAKRGHERAQSPDPRFVRNAGGGAHVRPTLTGTTGATSVPIRPALATTPLADLPLTSLSTNRATVSDAQLLQSSVRLTIEDATGLSYGTGTLIDSRNGEALVLTCGHIFRDSQGKGKVTVDLFGPQAPTKLPGRVISFDLKRDIGLVSVRPGVPVSVARVAPKGHRVARGEPVMTVGCNNGREPTVQHSQITAVDKFLGPANVQVSGQPVQGRSGGGLFTSDGLVIGVCNAADPADNEGLYAAAATIHEELDHAHLSDLYMSPGDKSPLSTIAAATPPPMSTSMPVANLTDLTPTASAATSNVRVMTAGAAEPGPAALPDTVQQLSPSERATLAELRKMSEGAEVICIVRSLGNPRAQSEIIVLDRASPAFLQQLAVEQQPQAARHLTSLDVPRAASTGNSPATARAPLVRPPSFSWRSQQ